ncbi:MAG: HAD family hydrolase [Promethearchaeota archaeon]
MNIKERSEIYRKYIISEIFGCQKVKLYKIKHFIFDFSGVMIERSFVLENLLKIIRDDLKISIDRSDPFFRKNKRRLSSGRISALEFLEKIFEKNYYPYEKENGALPPKRVNIQYYLELWFQLYSKITRFSCDMEIIVQRLHQAGYIVSLMSNVYDIYAKSNELRGFYDIFDNVFLSNEIGLIKPDFDKYKYVLNKLDAKPKQCIFIDDKIQNLIPARELGIIVARFESIEKFNKQLDKMGFKDVSKGYRREIKKKYKVYKLSKKEYKKAKRNYKNAKKVYLNKKRTSIKTRNKFKKKRAEFEKKKIEFKKQKKLRKEELESKIRIN